MNCNHGWTQINRDGEVRPQALESGGKPRAGRTLREVGLIWTLIRGNPFPSVAKQFELRLWLGFTVLELLVTIAIMAVVAALLLPALQASKQKARSAQCVDNLHQLGLAAFLYWDDNEWQTFPYLAGATNGGTLYWFGWLKPGPEGTREFNPVTGPLYPYLQGRGVEICPSLDYSSTLYKYKARGAAFNYGYNLYLGKKSISTSQIEDTSEIVLFADSAQVNDFQAPASPERPLLEEFYYLDASQDDYPNAHFRHQRRANVVMCDGHLERENPLPGSIDQRLPEQWVGRVRPEILLVP